MYYTNHRGNFKIIIISTPLMDLISATKSHIKEVSVRFYKNAVEKALKV